MDNIEIGKRSAAVAAVDEFVTNETNIIGIGSGSTIIHVVDALKKRLNETKQNIVCVPSSFQSRILITKNGLTCCEPDLVHEIDVAFDGADEVDDNLTCIKGGGACHAQEKLVAFLAKSFIVVADDRKCSNELGEKWKRGIPIEVLPIAFVSTEDAILKKFGGTISLRMAKEKAGPVVTDNGNFVLDWKFDKVYNWNEVYNFIKLTPGVVEVGLFVDMVKKAFFGKSDGSVFSKKRKSTQVAK